MSELLPSRWRGLYYSESFHPREVFSVSQVEKAFGSAHEPGRGCLRSWAYRYLAGLKEPEYTYEEACALDESTPELAKFKGGVKKKTYGKVFHSIAEAYYRGGKIDLSHDAANRFFSGSHLAPHPSQCAEIEIEKPIRVRTGADDDTITWAGFKDLVVRLPDSPRYLFDWKTTTPTVDNRRNRETGKPAGSWTWQKDEKAIRIDYQANLYAYDEIVNYGALPRGRWIYFANSGRPDARATDYEPEHELVIETVKTLDGFARELRDQIRGFRNERHADFESNVALAGQTAPNIANCMAFGGCPYRSAVGGPCTAEQSGVIPIGSLLKTQTRPAVKRRDVPELTPAFQFTFISEPTHERGIENPMGLAEQIEAAKAQRTGGQPPATTTGFAPQGAPPAPAWGGPSAPAAPAPGGFDPSFAFGAAPVPPAPAPVAPPAPAPVAAPPGPPVSSMYPPRGTATQNPDWLCDGTGGYIPKADFVPPAPAQETFPSHVNPPEAANPNIPAEPAKRGRPKKAPAPEPAQVEPRDTTPAPADFAVPELTLTLKLGTLVITVPAPAELVETLQAYVIKQVG